jgi:predicted MFS family arabinose efflux permease
VREPALRRAAITQGLLSVAFSGFWSTLAFLITSDVFKLDSAATGAFGIAGAFGAVAAPIAGSLADKRGPSAVVRLGSTVVVASFAFMGLLQGSLIVLAIGAVLFDLGVQACLISHQTVVYALDPAARSRLNAALVSVMFVGMSAGSALAAAAFSRYGWSGVCAQGGVAAVAALAISLTKTARKP